MAGKSRMLGYAEHLESMKNGEKKAVSEKPGSVLVRLRELKKESEKEAQKSG